ncbi:unnamed protein product [Lampetra planeri]
MKTGAEDAFLQLEQRSLQQELRRRLKADTSLKENVLCSAPETSDKRELVGGALRQSRSVALVRVRLQHHAQRARAWRSGDPRAVMQHQGKVGLSSYGPHRVTAAAL